MKFILKYFKFCTKILNIYFFFVYEILVNFAVNTVRLQDGMFAGQLVS
jgi:hypothetical protein